MPRYKYNVDEVELTKVVSGDLNNNIYYSFFKSNPEQKKDALKSLVKKNVLLTIVDKIFEGDITDDQLRKITTALTFYDSLLEITKSNINVSSVNDLYFALLVNWNASKTGSPNRIKSYSSLHAAKDSYISAEDGNLDYREFIINSTENDRFDNNYITIPISPNSFSCKMQLKLPIIKRKLGLFSLCTERVSGYLSVIGDPDNSDLMVPYYLWLSLIEEGMSKRATTLFSVLETRFLQKLVDTDANYINEILAINNYRSVDNFVNAYEMVFDDSGVMTLCGTQEPPKLKSNNIEWINVRDNEYLLNSYKFYIIAKTKGTVHILEQH